MLLSAIIPTLNEERVIARAVSACRAIADEVVVSDGGSADQTCRIAVASGARLIQEERGRGPQLNAGARAAVGDVLLFVHADTWLPPAARGAIQGALADPAVIGGNFRLRFDGDGWVPRLFTRAYHWQRVLLRSYFGDSCLFVRGATFAEIGGFPDLPLFEDQEFVRRLERHGRTRYLREVEVVTSARRFERKPWRVVLLWAELELRYALGVPAQALAKRYGDTR